MSLIEQQYEERQDRSQLSRDAEKLLELAEELQERSERYQRQEYVYMFLALGASMVLIWIGVYSYPYFSDFSTIVATVISSVCIICACGLAGFSMSLNNRSGTLYRRERRALHSIVDMLREIEPALADEENMSAIERATFKIRLARFDIGSEKKSANPDD